MGTTIGIIGLFVAIALLVVLAFKGHSVIIAAPIAAHRKCFPKWTEGTFMRGVPHHYYVWFRKLRENYFPIHLF